jgi:pimeloyl-ACP methyl ester carboxylesterase
VAVIAACFFLDIAAPAPAQDAQQVDALVSVSLGNGVEQAGLLTMVKGDAPSALVLLIPGDPGVIRPEVIDSKLARIRLRGHTFVRSRNLLVRPGLATVLVDCRSDQGDSCRESYVMSKERFDDVGRLLARLKQDLPTVKKVWVAGHSFGSHSSASLARYGEGVFDGAIHASAILSPRAAYKMLAGFDFSATRVPQLFVHHRNDPCPGTPFSQAEYAARRYNIPLVAVTQSAGARGGPCGPFSEHGFVGAEPALMQVIADAVERGVAQFNRPNPR